MSTVSFMAIAHVLLYGVAALLAYAALRWLVVQRRLAPFTASATYIAALAVLPSMLMRVVAALAGILFSKRVLAFEPSWDVSLAMSLLVSTWLCYAAGLLAGCLGSWSFFKSSPDARAA